ncbi:MAG: hypothetical protein CBC42_04320 [Betaproteobacteria bacterium TMED82]|nr:MAG: hypothetical protein CBC42_04320 [Betaproteobacteria bacterium TMED82]|tara:strand:+ start:13860 stop:14477 length:618 start_codon:yes stop_codon:yes gene_type:complete
MLWPKINILSASYLLGIKYDVKGINNMESCLNEPRIICANHQSTWETFFIASCLPKQVCFIFKKELLFVPFFGWGIFLLRMIHINRKSGKQALQTIIDCAPEQFRLGRWIVLFPEGTRSLPNKPKPYKIGAAVLSKNLNVPIVPISHNAGRLWEKNAFFKRAGVIDISIGESICPENKSPEEIITEVKTWIENQDQWKTSAKNIN